MNSLCPYTAYNVGVFFTVLYCSELCNFWRGLLTCRFHLGHRRQLPTQEYYITVSITYHSFDLFGSPDLLRVDIIAIRISTAAMTLSARTHSYLHTRKFFKKFTLDRKSGREAILRRKTDVQMLWMMISNIANVRLPLLVGFVNKNKYICSHNQEAHPKRHPR